MRSHDSDCTRCKCDDRFNTCDEPQGVPILLHRSILRINGDKYVKTFENATSLLLAVVAQALAIGVVLAI